MIEYIKEILWRIKDYDRLASDYSRVLDYATGGRMSKTNYYVHDIYSEIDEAQDDKWKRYIKEDIANLETKEDIIKYINNL